jgi:hypothetical protein
MVTCYQAAGWTVEIQGEHLEGKLRRAMELRSAWVAPVVGAVVGAAELELELVSSVLEYNLLVDSHSLALWLQENIYYYSLTTRLMQSLYWFCGIGVLVRQGWNVNGVQCSFAAVVNLVKSVGIR